MFRCLYLCTVTSVPHRVLEMHLLCSSTCSRACEAHGIKMCDVLAMCELPGCPKADACLVSDNKNFSTCYSWFRNINRTTFWKVLSVKIVEDVNFNVCKVRLVIFVHKAHLMALLIGHCLCFPLFLSLYQFHEKEIPCSQTYKENLRVNCKSASSRRSVGTK